METAYKKSWIFPGQGHFYSGQTGKGVLFTSLEAASLAGFFMFGSTYSSKADALNTAQTDYDNWFQNQIKKDEESLTLTGAAKGAYLYKDAGCVVCHSIKEDEIKKGLKGVVICPIGFVADHIEILYDLDTEVAAIGRDLDLAITRAASVNDNPMFLDMMFDLVQTTCTRYGTGAPLPLISLENVL